MHRNLPIKVCKAVNAYMGKLILKRFWNFCTFFTLGACQNSLAVQDNSCGGANIVDAAMYDATAILNNTASSLPHMGNCSADKSSTSGSDSRFWNATWMDSGREGLASSPLHFDWLARFNQKSCLVVL